METPKNSFLLSLLICLTILVTASCRPEEEIIDTPKPTTTTVSPDQIAVSLNDASKKAVGTWEMVEIEYGWTGAKDMPPKKMEITIDNSLNVVFFEESKETYRFQYVLKQIERSLGVPWGVTYTTIKQSGKPSIWIQEVGEFRVSDKKLIVGSTGNDGNHYTFQRK